MTIKTLFIIETMMLKSITQHFEPLTSLQRSFLFGKNPQKVSALLSIKLNISTCSTKCLSQNEAALDNVIEENSVEVLKKWGCNDNVLSELFSQTPSLRNAKINLLKPKLSVLESLGISSDDLVEIMKKRRRFLSYKLNHGFNERFEYLMTLFGSKEMIVKAIVRNPAYLTHDYHRINDKILLYKELGICGDDLIKMLLARPTMITRTSFCDTKLGWIRKAGITKDSKMFKHLVAFLGVSSVESIEEKVATLKKFGFSDEEIWCCVGRSPFLLTLSVDKIQRNMTFVTGTMKLPPNLALKYTYLIFNNLENKTRPRFLLAGKIQDMGLSPQIKGPLLLRALKMEDDRFLRKFVLRHPEHIAAELMEFFKKARGVKRLAEASKKHVLKGLPF